METDNQEQMEQKDMKEQMERDQDQMFYLMSPYTHDDKKRMKARVEIVNMAAADLIKEGRIVFSPLSHSHPIAETGIVENSHELWMRQGDFFIDQATTMVLLCLNGWDESEGVRHEILRGVVQGRKPLEIIIPMMEDDEKNLMSFTQMELVVPWYVPEWVVKSAGHYTSAIIEAIEVMISIVMELNPAFPITPLEENTLAVIMNMAMESLNQKDPTRLERSRPDIT